MIKQLTFAFIGGDMRQLYVANMLALDCFHIRVFGFDKENIIDSDGIYYANSLDDCISGADVVVLPLPYSSKKGVFINTPLYKSVIKIEELISRLDNNAILFAGKIDEKLMQLCNNSGIHTIDYSKREEFAIMNAIPTCEGAIELAMHNTPFTIKDSRCLVIGYGRIGKLLSSYLSALGAEVTATARKYSDLAWISANGCKSANTSDLKLLIGEFDIVFNTVPEKLLDFSVLREVKNDALIIDLASAPGGVDFDIANDLNKKTIWALSLPGKVAPVTAGKIIKDTIINILEELGV